MDEFVECGGGAERDSGTFQSVPEQRFVPVSPPSSDEAKVVTFGSLFVFFFFFILFLFFFFLFFGAFTVESIPKQKKAKI